MPPICLFVLLAASVPCRAQRSRSLRPDRGVFLVARPEIEGGLFWHSVVLLLSHGKEGTLGLIINRTTEVPLAEALPDLHRDPERDHALQFGGPVALDGLLFLFRTDEPPEKAAHVMKDVYFSGDRKVLEGLLEKGTSGTSLRIFLGHAGWAPRQLDAEILRGSWDLVRADSFTIFQKDPDVIWSELSGRDAGTVARARTGRRARPSLRSVHGGGR